MREGRLRMERETEEGGGMENTVMMESETERGWRGRMKREE